MSYELHDFFGNLGVVLILASYLLVQLRRLEATGVAYLVANSLGALLILYSLFFDFNLSAFVSEPVKPVIDCWAGSVTSSKPACHA